MIQRLIHFLFKKFVEPSLISPVEHQEAIQALFRARDELEGLRSYSAHIDQELIQTRNEMQDLRNRMRGLERERDSAQHAYFGVLQRTTGSMPMTVPPITATDQQRMERARADLEMRYAQMAQESMRRLGRTRAPRNTSPREFRGTEPEDL